MENKVIIKDKKKPFNKSAFFFMLPYVLLFSIFIVLPIIIAILLSFTDFNGVNWPKFNFLDNYIYLFTRDTVFMQYVVPNTLKFAIIVGPGGYILSFFLAWCLAQIPHKSRTVLAIILYTPSMTMGITISVLWRIIFSGNENGYLNALLLNWGLIEEEVQWLQDPRYLFPIMIIVSLWGSFGVGFLAMLSGILNIDQEIYEAAYIDGLKNRFQEIFYITVPMMKPQMLFGAVMSVVGSFNAGSIGVQLSGSNPTPSYAGQLMLNHIDDFAYNRYEIGQAAAVSVVLLLFVWLISKVVYRIFRSED